MPSFNKVMMIGNLTRDPQVKQLPSQTVLAEFGLAMNRKYRTAAGEDKEEVCFVDCTAFGKQAETIAQWCKKGKQLFIEGRLKYDTWDDKVGGGKRSKLAVVVENFQFLGSRDDANQGSPFGGGGPHPGTTGSMFDAPQAAAQATAQDAGDRQPHAGQADRTTAAEKRGPRGRASGRQGQSAEQPFGDEKMFQEADIPF